MKVKMVLAFVVSFMAFCHIANAGPDMCTYETTGDIATQFCDTDGNLLISVSTGTISVVNTVNDILAISATDIDIRNLTAASDTVTVTGDIGTVTTLTGITNDVSIDDGGNTITVDGTVSLSTTTVQITDGTDLALVDSSGNLHVTGVATIARLSTVEFKNDVIGVGAASGADLDPAAESYKFTVVNNATVDVWCKVGATPASGDGIPIKANGGSWTQENISVGDFECFNPDGAITAAVAVVFWR